MSSVNKAVILGNVTATPDIRSTQDGKEIASFSVATNQKWKTKDGTPQEKVEYHRIVIFSQGLVGIIKNYVKKGSKLYLEGSLQTRKWTDKEGVEKYTTEIILQGFNSKLLMLDSKVSQNDTPKEKEGAGERVMLKEDDKAFDSLLEDDDIPF